MNCIILTAHRFGPLVKTAGPYRLATELRLNGFTVQVIDITRLGDVKQLFILLLKFIKKDTLWIGISNTFMERFLGTPWNIINTYQYNNDKQIYAELLEKFVLLKNLVNKKFPNIKFIYGDAGVREDITSAGYIRFNGYVEDHLLKFTKECRDNYLIGNSTIYQKEFANFCNSKIHWTDRDLFMNEVSVPVEISRGCIFKCSFCRYPLNGKKKFDYIKDPDVLHDELLRNYELFGIKDYIFTDDTYNDSLHKLKLIKSVIDKLPFNINFSTYLRLDLMMRFPDMADILKDSGLLSCFFGLETRDAEDAKFIGKGVPFEQQIEYLHKIKQSNFKNINVQGGFILGLPNDNIDKIHSLFDWFFSADNPLDSVSVNTLKILPQEYETIFSSDIDINYKKYGYTLVNDEKGHYWVNGKNGLDQIKLRQLEVELYQKLRFTNKTHSFIIMDYLNLGLDRQDLMTLTVEELQNKYNIQQILNQSQDLYLKKLMGL